MQHCGSESQNISHLVLDCPVLDHLRRAIFGHSLSILDLWSRPWGIARLLGLRGVDPRPSIPRNGSGKPITTKNVPIFSGQLTLEQNSQTLVIFAALTF